VKRRKKHVHYPSRSESFVRRTHALTRSRMQVSCTCSSLPPLMQERTLELYRSIDKSPGCIATTIWYYSSPWSVLSLLGHIYIFNIDFTLLTMVVEQCLLGCTLLAGKGDTKRLTYHSKARSTPHQYRLAPDGYHSPQLDLP
jgi:hypothetical protein